MSEVQKPVSSTAKFISQLAGSQVVVKSHSGEEYHGILESLDGFLSVVLRGAKEYVNGKLIKEYGDVFIRSNNVLYIAESE